MPSYIPKSIEPRWQQYWLENKTFRTTDDPAKPKYYILDMFPYPSGSGLHVGHPEGYTATDILARWKRMNGFNVLHPMGWDAFGLPAEEHARKTGEHPRIQTHKNIDNFRRQIRMLGFSYDWDREVDTTDPNYYRWTQWIFLQLFDTWYDPEQQKGRPIAELPIPADVQSQGEAAVRRYQDGKRLAYQSEVPVNWCEALGTVLANEEVTDGKSERGGHPVVQMPLRQWLLRITAYAERLLADIETVDWPEPIKKMQRDWIGKSEGAEVDFTLETPPDDVPPCIRVFTTRPDTLFGATYMVLAPEHELVPKITTARQQAAVERYQEETARKSERERAEVKKKTGVWTGAYAINPVNNEKVPIWIADYVLRSYGTGAIMAVPAHDERDFAFAREFRLPMRAVVQPPAEWLLKTTFYVNLKHLEGGGTETDVPHTLTRENATLLRQAAQLWKKFGDSAQAAAGYYLEHPESFDEVFADEGAAVNSGEFSGLPTAEFKQKIIAWLEEKGVGVRKVNYKLRDWLFSRQRYWGEPFPILHELDAEGKATGLIRALDVSELPLTLPDVADYLPSGRPEPLLGKAGAWLDVTRDGKRYRRETNTMPQWAGSCWYYLRYIDAQNGQAFCAPAKEKHWAPVDLYVGGAEHAVLHLLYARFWHKVLFDRGHVHTAEPFQRLVNQGMILGETEYTVFRRIESWVSASEVDVTVAENRVSAKHRASGEPCHVVRLDIPQISKQGKAFVVKDSLTTQVHAQANAKGEREYFGFKALGAWVNASADIDPETGKHKKSGDVYHCIALSLEQVEKQGEAFVLKDKPTVRIDARAFKMAKSRGNVINPDVVVHGKEESVVDGKTVPAALAYGADALRLYEMFMGPLEVVKPWSMDGVEGVYRFLGRFWRLIIDDKAEEMKLHPAVQDAEPTPETLRLLHRTIKKVTEDLEGMRFNTAISAMMEFTNHLTPLTVRPKAVLEKFVLLLSPFAPHLGEELWARLGHANTLAYEAWPPFDPALCVDATIEVPVQVNGKLRAKLTVAPDIGKEALEAAARADDKVKAQLEGKQIKKVIVVPGKLVNIVVG